uniref:Uncharacterized protein n=1 Tax=candidate division CPR3 bacterium TaxID=2268181 RepID=A0A7C4R604_UNCC3
MNKNKVNLKNFINLSFGLVFLFLSLFVFNIQSGLAACNSDAECDDGTNNTADVCLNAGTSSSACENKCLNDYACEPSEQCNTSLGICIGVSPKICQNDSECIHDTRTDVTGTCINPNTSDPTASKVCLYTKNTNIVISACASAADCPVGKICENPGAPNSACVDPPTINPPSGNVPSSNDLMSWIVAVVVMIAGVKVSMSAVSEAGKIVDQGINKATKGKVTGVGQAAKMAATGAAGATVLGAKAFAGADLSKMKEDTKTQKALKAVAGFGQKATMGGLNVAAAPKAAKEKVEKWAKDRKKNIEEDFEKAQKKTAIGAWIKGESAEDLSGKNEKIEKIANDNMNRDVESIKRDMAKEIEKGANANKQKINGYALALKKISEGNGSGSPASIKGQEQKKQAEDLIKELESQAGVDMSKGVDRKVANGLVGLQKTNEQYVKDMVRGKYQGSTDDLIKDFDDPVGGGPFDQADALSRMSDDDIERAISTIGASPPAGADPAQVAAHANALRNIQNVRNQRIQNLTAGHQSMLDEAINNPSLATNNLRKEVYNREKDRIANAERAISSGDISSAKSLMTTILNKDMTNASVAQMNIIIEARKRALEGIRTANGW